MRKFLKVLAFATPAFVWSESVAWARPDIPCYGRQYPAKAIDIFARSAWVEVDLGFGLTYRGVIELDGTVEPDKPSAEWKPKATEALRQKLAGKRLTLCVVKEGMGAYFYADGENVNRYMVDKGHLSSITFKGCFNTTTTF